MNIKVQKWVQGVGGGGGGDRNECLKPDVDNSAFVIVIDFVMPCAIISYGDWFSLLIAASSHPVIVNYATVACK